jgi:hypothetical protein
MRMPHLDFPDSPAGRRPPEPAGHNQSPVGKEGKAGSRAAGRLRQLTAGHRAEAAAGRATAEAQRRREVAQAVNDMFYKLAGPCQELTAHLVRAGGAAAKAIGEAQQVFDKVAFSMLPVSSVWTLLSGLSRIGRIHHQAQVDGARHALSRGFAETQGLALDEPHHRRRAGRVGARGPPTQAHFSGLARSGLPIKDSWRRDFSALAARYLEGAKAAIRVVEGLTAEERSLLATRLARQLEGASSGDRLLGWYGLRPN